MKSMDLYGDLFIPVPWNDINCPCCGLSALDIRLHYALLDLEDLLPSLYKVTSLCRCPRHNAEVGGTPGSLHLIGRAVDLKPVDITLYQLMAVALTVPAFERGGIGLYPSPGILHLDIRPNPARWGKIGSQPVEFLQLCRLTWPGSQSPDAIPPAVPSPGPPPPPWQ